MSLARTKLRELLENDFAAIERIWKDVTKKRKKTKSHWATCSHCNHRVEVTVEQESYALKDIVAFANFAASYGIGKPPEEKKVDINITAKRLEELSDEELDAVIEGTARELPAG